MKRIFVAMHLAAAAILFAVPVFAQGQADKKPEPATAPAPGAASKPGAEQAFLAKRAGEYTRTIKFLGQPGTDASAFTGSGKISVVLDGRFIEEEYNDVVFGRPVVGLRLYGYNNVTKQYEAIWTNTTSTAMLTFAGTSSDGGKTVDYTGASTASDGSKINLHAHARQVDDDQFVITLSRIEPDGKDNPFQETTYIRKK